MRVVIGAAVGFGALFWWGVWTHTLLTFALYAASSALMTIAIDLWPRIEKWRARRRARRDWPRARADWGN